MAAVARRLARTSDSAWRADNGLGVPAAVYDFCEDEHSGSMCIGYASNPVLERDTAQAFDDVQLYYAYYGYRDPHVQRFEEIRDYQAGSWLHARRSSPRSRSTRTAAGGALWSATEPSQQQVIYRELYPAPVGGA